MIKRRTVTIPACVEHHGLYKIEVELDWVCPKCGGPRGEVFKTLSYDGSLRMTVDGWHNPCGHIDKYSEVREEVFDKGAGKAKRFFGPAHG